MKANSAGTIDACQARLHDEGWSIGDLGIQTTGGVGWLVFAQRGNQWVVATGRQQAVAWREAVRLAVGTNGG